MMPLNDLQRQIDLLQQELRETKESFQNFAYIISHDFGAPLRAITSFSDILCRKYEKSLDDKARTYLGFIHEGGTKAQAMLDSLLIFSRINSQGKPAVRFSFNVLVAEVFKEAKAAHQALGSSLEMDDDISVFADEPQIKMLLEILVDNAFRFRQPNVPLVLKIEAREKEQSYIFSIEDNGRGIPAGSQDKVFEIFRYISHDGVSDGLGCGLAIARRIVERHGGTISIESRQGAGSIVRFSLSTSGPHESEERGLRDEKSG